MQVREKVVVVTGGANGIGRGPCRRFAKEGARGIVVADLDAKAAGKVAEEIGGVVVATNVGIEADVKQLVERTIQKFGQIDLFCCNAGIAIDGGIDAPDEDWQRIWNVNLMSHVYAARAVVPGMVARGSGYFLQTASAGGIVDADWVGPVCRHKARRGCVRRMAVDPLRRFGHRRLLSLPARRAHQYVARIGEWDWRLSTRRRSRT